MLPNSPRSTQLPTTSAITRRARELAVRAAELSSLLRAPIEARIEGQNAQLLHSMERSVSGCTAPDHFSVMSPVYLRRPFETAQIALFDMMPTIRPTGTFRLTKA